MNNAFFQKFGLLNSAAQPFKYIKKNCFKFSELISVHTTSYKIKFLTIHHFLGVICIATRINHYGTYKSTNIAESHRYNNDKIFYNFAKKHFEPSI